MSLEDEKDQTNTTGKYWRVDVPDYAPDESNLRSYLRVGDTPPNSAAYTDEPGAELLAKGDAVLAEGDSLGLAERLDKYQRQSGWRDHTDGDRVTTTKGNKLEVVGGQYELVVGALASDANTEIQYRQKRTWSDVPITQKKSHVPTSVENGELCSVSKGNRYDFSFGELLVSYTGYDIAGGVKPENFEYETGADEADLPALWNRPIIEEHTWAKSMHSTTNVAGEVMSTTEVGGAQVDNTVIGGLLKEMTTIGGGQISKTNIGAGVATHDTIVGASMSKTEVGGLMAEMTSVGAAKLEHTEVAGLSASHEMIMGVKLDASEVAGVSEEHSHVGGLKTELSTAAAKLSLDLFADKAEMTLFSSATELSAGLIKTTIEATLLDLTLSAGIKLALHLGVDEDLTLPEKKITDVSGKYYLSQVEAYVASCKIFVQEHSALCNAMTWVASSVKLGA